MESDRPIKSFFVNLASRLSDENDLSDFVWALCQANEGFKQFVLDFFFRDEQGGKLKASEYRVDREVSLAGGRPDFVITGTDDKKNRYFIEIKKWDRNHHFKQYLKELEKDGHDIRRLGYITQYVLDPSSLANGDRNVARNGDKWACPVKTWGQFQEELKRCMDSPESYPWAAGSDVAGLYWFARATCPNYDAVTEFTLDINRIKRIQAFAKALDWVVKQEVNVAVSGLDKSVQLKGYYGKRDYEHSLRYIGRYFKASGLYEDPVWGWLGVYFSKDDISEDDATSGLTLEFENAQWWGAPVFDHLKSKKSVLDYCEPLELDDTIEVMQERIRASLSRMLAKCRKSEPVNKAKWESPDEFMDARRIMLFLDQNVLVNKDDLPIVFSSGSVPGDEFSSSGWIGRYSYVSLEGGAPQLIWVGVRYDGVKLTDRSTQRKVTADGSQVFLDIDGKQYVLYKSTEWNAEEIRRRIHEELSSRA
ncbi:MAG: hypothetical protein ACOX5G_03355 [Kiritimatiellia bacterium]|jgi:hypothetical protein